MEKTKLKSELEPANIDVMILTEIDEQQIIDITRNLVFAEKSELEEDDLLYEIINITKCDLATAKSIFEKFKELGLGVCYHYIIGYSIRKFAEMRGYVSNEELKQLDGKKLETMKKADQREAQFLEKYGSDKAEWSNDVWEEYEYGD